ncbi:hypothetical protein JY817_18730 [Clostridioides difficile]|uniref:DUF6673 domain-containing protein n=2 Tax=Leicestervirus CD382 TaxID=2843973 RepID=A0A1J1JCF3_9CAUD|nr:DUF6673 family protein [Clostridioides difficile]ALY06957.1 hypothetical protein CDHS1_14 [Clostridium phage CDSH1]CUL03812.1 hypothetical protein [Clostridium phage slur17]EGT4848710.1 hypothetical protein [Clostridioides difficile]MBH6943839.1 hypothetical protein [Clostridioides difficile]MCG3604142.1 hypothetical protein [Clostridioides difficile]
MLINNIELKDFDIYDADEYENIEKTIGLTITETGKVEKEATKGYEMIRDICNLIFKCFDDIFGEGTSNKMFGDKRNLKVCSNAFFELIEEVNRQKQEGEEFFASAVSKYTPNRAQRRAKK